MDSILNKNELQKLIGGSPVTTLGASDVVFRDSPYLPNTCIRLIVSMRQQLGANGEAQNPIRFFEDDNLMEEMNIPVGNAQVRFLIGYTYVLYHHYVCFKPTHPDTARNILIQLRMPRAGMDIDKSALSKLREKAKAAGIYFLEYRCVDDQCFCYLIVDIGYRNHAGFKSGDESSRRRGLARIEKFGRLEDERKAENDKLFQDYQQKRQAIEAKLQMAEAERQVIVNELTIINQKLRDLSTANNCDFGVISVEDNLMKLRIYGAAHSNALDSKGLRYARDYLKQCEQHCHLVHSCTEYKRECRYAAEKLQDLAKSRDCRIDVFSDIISLTDQHGYREDFSLCQHSIALLDKMLNNSSFEGFKKKPVSAADPSPDTPQ